MLYLAEVKKQTRIFMGGTKTELKLLACQHNDQTWSAVPSEEILICDETVAVGEGTLLLVNVGNNRQLQGAPEFAGAEIVRQLQKISRLLERGKEDQEKIEQWKQSLTYQSEILNRQKMEMEARLEQIEHMEAEFEYLDRQRQELEALKKQLEERRDGGGGEARRSLPEALSPAQATLIESLLDRFTDGSEHPNFPLPRLLESARQQQDLLTAHWHTLEESRRELSSRREESERLAGLLARRPTELNEIRESIEAARVEIKIQETILSGKRELLGRVNLSLQMVEEAREMVTRLGRGEDLEFEGKIDIEAIERLPERDLEALVKSLTEDLERLRVFVNDQEEELTLQSETVEELQAKRALTEGEERTDLELEIAEEQERKRMLDETLVGQRRNLRERQAVLSQHLKVLRRLRGEGENEQRIKVEPLFLFFTERYHELNGECRDLEDEIEMLGSNLQPLREMLESRRSEQENEARELEEQERKWRSADLELTRLQARVQMYESMLQPIQDRLDEIRRDLGEISEWFPAVGENGRNSYPVTHG